MNTSALLFHDVSPDSEGKFPGNTLSPDRFQQLMRRLAKAGYTGVSARDWWNAHHGGPALPTKPVVITFDDGYSSITDHALPLLRSLGFRATVFIVTSCIGGTNEWDRLWGKVRLMDADQIRYWAGFGMEFGSHSAKHRDLTKMNPPELERDISSSNDELSSVLRTRVITFAYPYGRHNQTVRRIVGRTFPIAFSTQRGLLRNDCDPLQCSRVEVKPNYPPTGVFFYLRFPRPSEICVRVTGPALLRLTRRSDTA
jgi:peptidoglycan/xylan/chitin deacetylase (PgdA/CDA1 family)